MAPRTAAARQLPTEKWRPTQAVPDPILNNPYEEPQAHWIYQDGKPFRQPGRRPASYYFKVKRTGTEQQVLFAEEERDDLPLVNRIRDDVKRWREAGYRGASKITKDLLRHWNDPSRQRRLFFCQIEAAETLIYLLELAIPERLGATGFRNFKVDQVTIGKLLAGVDPEFEEIGRKELQQPRLVDIPADAGLLPLTRLGCKMATGSGKTIVMAMLVAWAFANRGTNPATSRFPSAVLVCAPNLTVKNRLQVLRPEHEGNYYDAFDLLPPLYREHMSAGRVLVTNWHLFASASEHSEGGATYKVVDKGEESPEAFARNRLGELSERMPLLVLNDEGHHCWRPKTIEPAEDDELTPEEEEQLKGEEEEARVWLAGLDRINNSGLVGTGDRSILACVDLSATPFYLAGSGYIEGSPFPWVVSDFGLVDAIESGIVKVPRLPVSDDREKPDEFGMPHSEYFQLWDHVLEKLSPKDFVRKRPKPDAVYREAEPALTMLWTQWKARYDGNLEASRDRRPIPPAMIVVCENTDLARVFYERISGEAENEDGSVARTASPFPELGNTETARHTFRIDTKLLARAEAEQGETRDQAAQALRELVNTVGLRGKPGEQVRCVVSVSMLTEGWDANNVTHIFGLRPFRSQLLCEQVVGRGLRRTSYTPDPATGLLPPEYVDVYGIPFSLIPFKGKTPKPDEDSDPVYHHIHALPEREAFEIRVPVVEGYTYALRRKGIRCDVPSIPEHLLNEDPTEVYLAITRGYAEGAMSASPGEFIRQDRREFYETVRMQQVIFGIAKDIVHALEQGQARTADVYARHELFPEIVRILEEYVRTRVRPAHGVDLRELAHEKHVTRIREKLLDAIQPAAASELAPLVPLLNRFKPWLSTRDVNERTTRPVVALEKSHLNFAMIMSEDERFAIKYLESSPLVECFVSNTRHLGLQIPYEYEDNQYTYIPDFIIRLRSADGTGERLLVLEIKGGGGNLHPNQVAAKTAAAQKWAAAASNLRKGCQWMFRICHEMVRLPLILSDCAGEQPERTFPWREVPSEERDPWVNCLPVTSLKAAAGSWSREQASLEDSPEWAEMWVKPIEDFPLERGMFIAQVQGDSMVPLIPNGAWCVFRPPRAGTRQGRIVLVWHSGISDAHTGGQYTVKEYRSEKAAHPEQGWHHTRIELRPRNPGYPSIILEPRDEGEVRVIAEFERVL